MMRRVAIILLIVICGQHQLLWWRTDDLRVVIRRENLESWNHRILQHRVGPFRASWACWICKQAAQVSPIIQTFAENVLGINYFLFHSSNRIWFYCRFSWDRPELHNPLFGFISLHFPSSFCFKSTFSATYTHARESHFSLPTPHNSIFY